MTQILLWRWIHSPSLTHGCKNMQLSETIIDAPQVKEYYSTAVDIIKEYTWTKIASCHQENITQLTEHTEHNYIHCFPQILYQLITNTLTTHRDVIKVCPNHTLPSVEDKWSNVRTAHRTSYTHTWCVWKGVHYTQHNRNKCWVDCQEGHCTPTHNHIPIGSTDGLSIRAAIAWSLYMYIHRAMSARKTIGSLDFVSEK